MPLLPRPSWPTSPDDPTQLGGSASMPTLITITRDSFGVPHIDAPSDAGAYYGAGYSAAQDRLGQMMHIRVVMDGRSAEFYYESPADKALITADKLARLWGWRRHAAKVIAQIDSSVLELLQAYADGVNLYKNAPGNIAAHRHILDYGLPTDDWTPEDCVLAWICIAKEFAPVNAQEARNAETLLDWETSTNAQGQPYTHQEIISQGWAGDVVDDAAAVVQAEDVDPQVLAGMQAFADAHGIENYGLCQGEGERPPFSNAWAVQGQLMADGRSLLVGDPRFQVSMPNGLYEWHMRGDSFDVRGAGIAGSPNILVGSSSHCAWSVTSASFDQADSFELEFTHTRQGVIDGYMFAGQPRGWAEKGTEVILVKGGDIDGLPPMSDPAPVVTYRRSLWGPVFTVDVAPNGNANMDYPGLPNIPIVIEPSTKVINAQADFGYSIRRVPLADPGLDPHAGYLNLYRARNCVEFHNRLNRVTFPPANIVFSDSAGDVGYGLIGSIPVRTASAWMAPHVTLNGDDPANLWQREYGRTLYVPQRHKPHRLLREGGYVFSGNNLSAGSWYPLRSLLRCGGDYARSHRLRTLLDQADDDGIITRGEMIRTHEDAHYQVAVEMIELANATNFAWSTDTLAALPHLSAWAASGGNLRAQHYGVALATRLSNALRKDPHDLGDPNDPNDDGGRVVAVYGQGEFGLCAFIRGMQAKLNATPPVALTVDELRVIDVYIGQGKRNMGAVLFAKTPQEWLAWWIDNKATGEMPRWNSLFFAKRSLLLSGADKAYGPFRANGKSILNDAINTVYSQMVSLGIPDDAHSMLAWGQSEIPGNVHEDDQRLHWERARFKRSPQSMAGILALGAVTSETILMP